MEAFCSQSRANTEIRPECTLRARREHQTICLDYRPPRTPALDPNAFSIGGSLDSDLDFASSLLLSNEAKQKPKSRCLWSLGELAKLCTSTWCWFLFPAFFSSHMPQCSLKVSLNLRNCCRPLLASPQNVLTLQTYFCEELMAHSSICFHILCSQINLGNWDSILQWKCWLMLIE